MGIIFRILHILTTFIQTIIVFRIFLKLINANISHTFVNWVYDTSDIFIDPFKGILSNEICLDKFCTELTPIVALIFFGVISFVFSELAKSSFKTE